MIDHPAYERPASAFSPACVSRASMNLTYTRLTPAASSARWASRADWNPASPAANFVLSFFTGRGIRRSSTVPYQEHSSLTFSYMSPYSWLSTRASGVTMLSMSRMHASEVLLSPAGMIGRGISGGQVGHSWFGTDRRALYDEVFVTEFHTV